MRIGLTWLVTGTLVTAVAACSDAGTKEVNESDYVAALAAVCIDTRDKLDALPDPPEQISITDFAAEASNALSTEAEQIRRLRPPGDLEDDHRAFIRNTDEQAAAWDELRLLPSGDTGGLEPIVTTIGELTLGRNDLALEMGVPACQRSPR